MKLTKNDYYPLATVRKIREAELFLKLTKDHMISNPSCSEAMFNAFIQSIWSVTQYLKKELSNFDDNEISSGALAWYEEAIKKAKENRTCRLFWELRTECAHRQVVESKPIVSATCLTNGIDIKIDGFFISYFEKKMKKFKDYDSKNLLNLAEEHISIIRSIVDEAVDKFGFKDLPLKNFHTKPGYIKLEAKARVMNWGLSEILKQQNKK
jgi:hypothetical protein